MAFLLPLTAFCTAFFLQTAGANGVPALFVFGDSTLDVGNNNYLPRSLAKANYPPYGIDYPHREPTGRFSNGYNTADFLGRLAVLSPFEALWLVHAVALD